MNAAAAAPLNLPPALAKALQQRLIYGQPLQRRDLLNCRCDWPTRPVRIGVVRNTPFEPVAAVMTPFLAHTGLVAEWAYSDYDDSLTFNRFDAEAVLVWLEFARYHVDPPALAEALAGRLEVLRARTRGPILFADAPLDEIPAAEAFNRRLAAALTTIPGAALYPRSTLAARLGDAYRDPRLARVGGSDLSARAGLEIAREIGLSWLPALLDPPVKCLALDLDNTLYAGVLGEDGPEGVALTPAHRALQQRLVRLQDEGVLLALVSRNEPEDVERLFAARPDFPLRPEMISARAIGWDAKSLGLAAIAARLNIGPDAVMMVDDNLGEIAEAAAALPGITALHAADPEQTLRALDLAPGLRRLTVRAEDRLRAADLSAREERERLSAAGDAAYIAALKPRLCMRLAGADDIGRLQELSIKTNQFNLGLRRLTEAEAAGYVGTEGAGAVGVALSDALSDSGVVLSLFARAQGPTMVVEDLCISCRALGRGLDDAMALGAALGLAERLGARSIAFVHKAGPRNAPALRWLSALAGAPVEGDGRVEIEAAAARARLSGAPIATDWD